MLMLASSRFWALAPLSWKIDRVQSSRSGDRGGTRYLGSPRNRGAEGIAFIAGVHVADGITVVSAPKHDDLAIETCISRQDICIWQNPGTSVTGRDRRIIEAYTGMIETFDAHFPDFHNFSRGLWPVWLDSRVGLVRFHKC